MLTLWPAFSRGMRARLRGPRVRSGGEKTKRVRTGVGLHFVSAGDLISHMPSSYENKVELAVITAKTRDNNKFDVKYCSELCRRPVKEGDSEYYKTNTDSSIFTAF